MSGRAHTYPGDGYPHVLEGTGCPCEPTVTVVLGADGAEGEQVIHRWMPGFSD